MSVNAAAKAAAENIDIPDSAYEKAEDRYEDLGAWLRRDESFCRQHDPGVFAQGSFLLGTVVRPVDGEEEYDLDLACKLREKVSKSTHTQKEVKATVGKDLEAYRKARRIQETMEEKRRCWRLFYQDDLQFHMDIVPCIPEEIKRRMAIKEAMTGGGSEESLAQEVAGRTVAITDNEHPNYASTCRDWNVSNPQGYGRWFRSRVRLARKSIRRRLRLEAKDSVEELPTYKLKAPLQRCVQLLKRHRDVMFKGNSERQPISIIITTLAAEAYRGEESVASALANVLDAMDDYVNDRVPRVPNPVNPNEDFADKWRTGEGRRLDLEGNFYRWLKQAQADFRCIMQSGNVKGVVERASEALEVELNRDVLQGGEAVSGAAPKTHTKKKRRIEKKPKPWHAL